MAGAGKARDALRNVVALPMMRCRPRGATSWYETIMLENIRSFFTRTMRPLPAAERARQDAMSAAEERHRLHVAACALLLELAHADDEFTPDEREHVEAVVRRHLDVDEETARGLIELAEAERRNAIDLYQFTSLIRENYDLGQKTLLAEIMWGVVQADGQIGQHESYLLRKIANLLDIKPGYLFEARRRAGRSDAGADE